MGSKIGQKYNVPSNGGDDTQTVTLLLILVVSIYYDAKSYRIPNWLIAAGYVLSIGLLLFSFGKIEIGQFLLRAFLPVATLYLLHLLNGIGAGDIKLLSVMSTIIGYLSTMKVFCLSVIFAGPVAAILILKRGEKEKRKMHYSFFITAGFLALKLYGKLL